MATLLPKYSAAWRAVSNSGTGMAAVGTSVTIDMPVLRPEPGAMQHLIGNTLRPPSVYPSGGAGEYSHDDDARLA